MPDLAEGEPLISADNRTITVGLRPGVRFSPPVNREVTAADVKYAFERAFTRNVPSGYATSYFADMTGAPDAPGAFRSIAGIKAPDDRALVLELDKPTAVTVAAALVMPITIPVPKEYAPRFEGENPSTYDQYTVFTWPYMVRNDAEGKVVWARARQEHRDRPQPQLGPGDRLPPRLRPGTSPTRRSGRPPLRQLQPPVPALASRREGVALVGRQCGEVDRRLRVGGEDDEHIARRQPGQGGARLDQRKRAVEPAGVDDVLHTMGA